MSKPIAYASNALHDKLLNECGILITGVNELAKLTVRTFLENAKREGRFDNNMIDKLLADLEEHCAECDCGGPPSRCNWIAPIRLQSPSK